MSRSDEMVFLTHILFYRLEEEKLVAGAVFLSRPWGLISPVDPTVL